MKKIIKWEFIRLLKTRVQSFFLFKKLNMTSLMLVLTVLKLFEAVSIFLGLKLLREYSITLKFLPFLPLFYFMIDCTDLKRKMRMIKKDEINVYQAYLLNKEIDSLKIQSITEIVWTAVNGISVYIPLFLGALYFYFRLERKIAIFTAGMAYLVTVVFLYISMVISKRTSPLEKTKVVCKYILLILTQIIGMIYANIVLSCPLSLSSEVMSGLKKWIVTFKEMSFLIELRKLICSWNFYYSLLVEVGCFILIKMILKKIKTEKSLGFLSIIIIGLLSGILMNGSSSRQATLLLVYMLLFIYATPYIITDLFENNNQFFLDFENEKIIFWKDNINRLYQEKKSAYIKKYIDEIIMIYLIILIPTIKSLIQAMFSVVVLFHLIMIGYHSFHIFNLTAVDNPIRANEKFTDMNFSTQRRMDITDEGGKIVFLCLGYGLVPILFATGDIKAFEAGLFMILAAIGINSYLYIKEKDLKKKMNEKRWITYFFGGNK